MLSFPLQLLLEGLTCLETMNKKDCNRQEACVWDKELDGCYRWDLRKGHEDSPCVKAAPRYFDLGEAWTICLRQDSYKRCRRTKHCSWYSEGAKCEARFDSVFFGIAFLEYKAWQVEESKRASLEGEYKALPSSDNFTWQSYLDHKPSRTECPFDIEPLVCKYVDALLSGILGPQFYCGAKYKSAASECNADALCQWGSYSDWCFIAPSVHQAAQLAAATVLTDSMPEGQDRRLAEAMYACAYVEGKGSCKGTCIWDPRMRECGVKSDYMAAILTEPGKNTTDAICTVLAVVGNSDCYTQFTKKKCHKTELCRWIAEDECQPNNEFYVAAAADRDPEMKKRYQTLKKQCLTYTTKKTCMKPSTVY